MCHRLSVWGLSGQVRARVGGNELAHSRLIACRFLGVWIAGERLHCQFPLPTDVLIAIMIFGWLGRESG